jgi:signal transduction histidine kinase
MKPLPKFFRSLECQLMAISLSATVAALVGAGGLATWGLYSQSVMAAKAQHEDTVTGLMQAIDNYQDMSPSAEALNHAIAKYADSDTWIQVEDPAGTTLPQSRIPDDLEGSLSEPVPLQPQLMQVDNRWVVACKRELQMKDGSRFNLTIFDDVTRSYTAYLAFRTILIWAGTAAVAGSTLLGLLLIRRSLRPLHTLSQTTANLSFRRLEDARLSMLQSPTEVEQLVGAFNTMLNRLSDAWTKERQLLDNISHELRTPLAIVQGYLESTLRRGDNLTELQRESLQTALEESQRTVRLLKEMIELARAESGTTHLRVETIEVHAFLLEMEKLARCIVPNPIVVEMPSAPVVWVRGDRDRLKQVLFNLISNAGRYSSPESLITLGLQTSNAEVSLTVRDCGVGIAPAEQSRIFDRFYRVEGSRCRHQGGVGLGLAIAAALMDQMNGTIHVESQPGKGSTFALRFPRLIVPRYERNGQPSATPARSASTVETVNR